MANEVYLVRGTPVKWDDTTGTETISLNGLGIDAATVGVQKDWGASAQPDEYIWRMTVQFNTTTMTVGETVDLYLSTSDGTEEDGQVGTADASTTTDKLANLLYCGSVVVDTDTAAVDHTASGTVRMYEQYCSPVVHNNTASALQVTNNVSEVTLTPIYYQTQ